MTVVQGWRGWFLVGMLLVGASGAEAQAGLEADVLPLGSAQAQPARAASASGRGDARVYLEFAELVMGHPLRPAVRRRVVRDLQVRARRDPGGFARETADLQRALAQLRPLRGNAAAMALARRQLLESLYWETAGKPVAEVPEVVRTVLRDARVLGSVPQQRILVTGWDVDAYVQMDRFVAGLLGVRPSFGPRRRRQLEQFFRIVLQRAASDPAAAQMARALGQMFVTWVRTRAAWAQLPPAQQQALMAQMRAQLQAARQQQQAQLAQQQALYQGWLAAGQPRGPMSMHDFGARMSQNFLYSNIFMQNMNMLAGN